MRELIHVLSFVKLKLNVSKGFKGMEIQTNFFETFIVGRLQSDV